MLGPVQRAWLLDKIAASRQRLMVLCSPVPWVLAAKGNSKDTWNGFRAERQQILDQLAKHHKNRSGADVGRPAPVGLVENRT